MEADGVRIRSRRRLRKTLESAWVDAHRGEISTPDVLPHVELTLGTTFVKIFGVAHGQRRVAKASPEVMNVYLDLVAEAQKSGASIATEAGIGRLFGLGKEVELRYGDRMAKRVGIGGMFKQAARMLVLLPIIPFIMVFARFSSDPMDNAIVKALSDPTEMKKLWATWTATQLPVPLRWELSSSAFTRIHSEVIAEAISERIAADAPDELVVLVGLAHVDELIYLLTT